uniref:Uncharacterized protein n=1 Tax=Panagrolaimus davidi TaxID=227884 RepID=A0A914Q559_9BILA
MHTFMFIVAILSLLLSFVAADRCNESVPLFPGSKGEEIHAMLARDRYINFTGWIPGKREYEGVGPEKIPYGYLKEMLLHFESTSEEGILEARIFLTSKGKNETIFLYEISYCNDNNLLDVDFVHQDIPTAAYCPLREHWIKFKIFKDGVKVDYVYISKHLNDVWNSHIHDDGCHQFWKNQEYSNIDGLLIEINCKTTEVKKILVKCEPY